jgi:hypothetical protein
MNEYHMTMQKIKNYIKITCCNLIEIIAGYGRTKQQHLLTMNDTPLPIYSVNAFQLAEETYVNLRTDGQTNNSDDGSSEKFV